MQLQILQHVDFEGPGLIADWARERSITARITRILRGEEPPLLLETGGLVVMGGPMNLSDKHQDPLLEKEKAFLKDFLASGKKVLGICLGAQLLAQMLGARVFRNRQKEIGWFPVWKHPGTKHPLLDQFPEDRLPAFHWHGDTFDLPENALRLFSSEATPNQAFVWNNQVYGLQFHWEVKPENVRMLINHAGNDLEGEHPFVQSPATMLSEENFFSVSKENLSRLMDFIFTEV